MRSSSKKGLIRLAAIGLLIQIALDLSHSVTAFPFVHYGMFSESFSRPDSLVGFEILANGRSLRSADFRIDQWDMIQQPLWAFDRQKTTDDFAFDKSKFRKALPSLYATVSAHLDNAALADDAFPEWYCRYLGSIIGLPVRSLLVNRCVYRCQGPQFLLRRKTPWIIR